MVNGPKVTRDDQSKINRFARTHTSVTEFKKEIEVLKLNLRNLEDAGDDIELYDEDESGPIPYQIGDTFVMHNLEEIGNLLTDEKRKTQSRILNLESKLIDAEKVLTQLKADLYGKFGNEINLEADDE